MNGRLRPFIMRVMIVGGDGVIGGALATELVRRGEELITTSRRATLAPGHVFLDLAGDIPNDLPECDVAVICAAMTRFADCRSNPILARIVNVVAPTRIARSLAKRGTKVLFLSSGAVFDSSAPHVTADTPPNPRSVYGAQKAQAEAAILALGPRMGVLRFSKVLYPGFWLFAQWTNALMHGNRVRAFTNHALAPIALSDAVAAVIDVMGCAEGGIFQVSGSSDISYFDAANHIAQRVGAAGECIIACRAEELIPHEEIMTFASLDTTRLTKLTGFIAPQPASALDAVLPAEVSVNGQCG